MLKVLRLIVVAMALGSALAHGTEKPDLSTQMTADLMTYESCIRSMTEKYLSSDATATEVAITADRNCSVYHDYYLDRAQQLIEQSVPPGEGSRQELARVEIRSDLLKEFRATIESHREHVMQRVTALVVSARASD